jgi:hypothetical protein
MNQAFHQLIQLIQQGVSWVLRTLEALWVWSWAQIAAAFNMSWANLPAWKIVVAVIAVCVLLAMMVVLFQRALGAFSEIAAAFWTMVLTVFGVVGFVVLAGLLSKGVTWVVATVPDRFWEKFL